MSPFYFAELNRITEDEIILSGAESKHLTRVMRVKRGEKVTVTDGTGMTYECSLAGTTRGDAKLSIISRSRNRGEPLRQVTLGLGLSPATKFDIALQMCVEIGVSGFAPLICEKSKVKLESVDRVKSKMRRWREVLKASIKQCERSRLPEIAQPLKFENYLQSLENTVSLKVIATPHISTGISKRGKEALAANDSLILLVGPDSGFTEREIKLACDSGFSPVSLPERILRTQTAAAALAALAVYSGG